ncbi:hypothetical protein OG900_33520 [Streptomyces sp. NBC_00433]
MSPQISADDVAAIRAEDGNLRDFIEALTASRPAAAAPPPPPVIGSANGPLHKPGAWPSGTRTDRPTCHPDCDCATHRAPAAYDQPAADTDAA